MYKAYINTLLSYGSDAKGTFLESSCFIQDKADSATTNKIVNNEKKSGYAQRKELVKESKEFNFSTNLHVDFFNTGDDKVLLSY